MSNTTNISISPTTGITKNKIRIPDLSFIICHLLLFQRNTPTVRSRDGVIPASSLLSLKRQGKEVEAGNTPTVRSWEVYFLIYLVEKIKAYIYFKYTFVVFHYIRRISVEDLFYRYDPIYTLSACSYFPSVALTLCP